MRGPTLFLIGICTMTSIPAEAEVCLTSYHQEGPSLTPSCVSYIELERMAKERGFGPIQDFDQHVDLSTENDRPFALVWHTAYLRPGIGPDLKAAVEAEQLRARLSLDLQKSACNHYRDFISARGIVQLRVMAYSERKFPIDPQNDPPAASGNVAEIRVDHCSCALTEPGGPLKCD